MLQLTQEEVGCLHSACAAAARGNKEVQQMPWLLPLLLIRLRWEELQQQQQLLQQRQKDPRVQKGRRPTEGMDEV
jgi:hypothetical protein